MALSSFNKMYNFGQVLVVRNVDHKKGERRRASIENAICGLLENKPLSIITVTDICKKAEIAHGTFYIYFSDRQALVSSLLLKFISYIQTVMLAESRLNDDPVRKTTAVYFSLYEQNTGLMKCLLNYHEEFPESQNAFQKLNREWALTVVEATLRKYEIEGLQAAKDKDELLRCAYALGGLVDQYLMALFIYKDPTLSAVSQNKDQVIDTLTSIWKAGMQA